LSLICRWNFSRGDILLDDSLSLLPSSLNIIGENIVQYISDDGTCANRYWKPWILRFDAPFQKLDYYWGGYSRFDFGSIVVSPDMFDDASEWPPPTVGAIDLWYTPDTWANRELVFSGAVHRGRMSPNGGIVYDMKSEKYGVKLLCERTDYNSENSAMPRAFGAVTHARAKRLPDSGATRPTFWKAHLDGTVGVDWHAYDDGVNIDSNVIEPAYDPYVFELTSTPAGEVTISGTGDNETLDDLLTWACTGTDDEGNALLALSFDNTNAESPSPSMAHYAESQQLLTDFCSEVAAWFTHLFYINDGTLYLVDMDTDNGTASLSQFQFSTVDYESHAPVALLKSSWITRSAVEETIGKYIKNTESEATHESFYSYGDERNIKPFHTTKSTVEARLSAIETIIHSDWVTIKKPLSATLPTVGKAYTLTDSMWPSDISVSIRAREIRYDFDAEQPMLAITGNGTIS